MARVLENKEKPVLTLPTKVYKGVKMFINEIEDIEKIDMLEDDVWICTYPRSGTTLTMEMVYLIQTLDFQTAKSVPLEARVPVVEVTDDRYPYMKDFRCIDQRHMYTNVFPTEGVSVFQTDVFRLITLRLHREDKRLREA